MNKYLVGRLLICLLVMFVASARGASNYFYDSEEPYPSSQDGDDNDELEKTISDDSLLDNIRQQAASKRSSLIQVYRRSCIRRGGTCEHRSAVDCCYNSSCRCNLWGTNCRCQRMGLFQKWG